MASTHSNLRRTGTAGIRRVSVVRQLVLPVLIALLGGTQAASGALRSTSNGVDTLASPEVEPSKEQQGSVQATDAGLFGFEVGLGVAAVVVVSRKRRR